MTSIVILIPVLNRPERVAPLLQSIRSSGRYIRMMPLFLVSPDDHRELQTIDCELAALDTDPDADDLPGFRLVVGWPPGPGDYARKINHGFRWACGPQTGSFEFAFLGADDLEFHPGWAERALAAHLETGACVIGTNDCGNAQVQSGRHSTHSLVHRDYLECGTVDEPGKILHEGYDHNWVDNEFVETARARGTFVAARDALVEHHHPFWGKAPQDDTYRKGRARFQSDLQLYRARVGLWEGR